MVAAAFLVRRLFGGRLRIGGLVYRRSQPEGCAYQNVEDRGGGGIKIKRARSGCGIPTWEAKSETVDPARTLKRKIQNASGNVKNFQD